MKGRAIAMDAAAHILVVSIPAPGHLIPSTVLAHQLAATGAQVTFLSTGYVFQHLQHGGTAHQYVPPGSSTDSIVDNDKLTPNSGMIRFDGLMPFEKFDDVTLDKVMKWQQELNNDEMEAALELKFQELQPTPRCIVADMFIGWVSNVAAKFQVPCLTLFPMPASDLAFMLRVPELLRRGDLPFTLANVSGGKKKDITLPGMPAIHAYDVWDSLADGNHPGFALSMRLALNIRESPTLIVNTFEELEVETLKALRTDFVVANIKVPKIFPVLLSNIPRMQRPQGFKTSNDREDPKSEVEMWLDTQASASVIYISFGSMATLTENEIVNLALALEASNYPFLWVHRPPGKPQVHCNTANSQTQNSHEYFPPGFQERVSGRALVFCDWAPQLQILTHPATGAFLTHCGWNSALESICAGVPMIGWPCFADQRINARLISDTAQVGFRIQRDADDTVPQDEIEKVLKQMMDSEEGKAARSNALKFKLLAQANVADGGASRNNLSKIVNGAHQLQHQLNP